MSNTTSWYIALVAARLLVLPHLAPWDACSATPYPLSRIAQDAAFVSTPFLPRLSRRTRAAAQANSGATSPAQMMAVIADGEANAASSTAAPAAFMTVTTATAAEHDAEQHQLKLRNPDGVSEAAIQDGLDLYHSIMACEDPELKGALQEAIQVLNDGLRLYGPDQLIGSYNGGKDAVVIMHLHRAAVANYCVQQGEAFRTKLIYFENDREFPEVEALVADSVKRFDLELSRYKTGFVEGLKQRMAEGGSEKCYGFVLGTRKGDPNCGVQTTFTPSR
ncbi:unnamed protein product [Ectocarpus sp. 13 AM-2016]